MKLPAHDGTGPVYTHTHVKKHDNYVIAFPGETTTKRVI